MRNIIKGRLAIRAARENHSISSNISANSDHETNDPACKFSVVMVGCGSVGKSSVTLRFVYDEFEESYDPTRADSYRKKFHNQQTGEALEIDILDTAGQEEYAAIRDNYYRSGEGFILVYSITDRASFAALSDFRLQIIRSLNDPNPPILLLGNKRDLQDTRKVSEVEARALIDKWGGNCQWREVSAKLGQGINEAFLEITKQIQSKRQDTNEKSKEKKKKHHHHNRSSKLIKNCQIQ